MLIVATAAAAISLRALWRETTVQSGALLSWATVVGGLFGWLLWLARPFGLPMATGPDLTHHLQLIRYLDQHWRLVHDPAIEAYLGEMTYYTPGSHILASLAGAWAGTTGLHALQTLLSAVTALKAGFVALIARRLLPASPAREPLCVAAALTLFASHAFFLGPFLEYGFVAQVVAELFVVSAWWALVVWDQEPRRRWLYFFGVSTAAVFLTWPVLVGPPILLFGALWLLPRAMPMSERLIQAVIAGALPALYAGLFMYGRTAFVQMAGTGGKTAIPSIDAYGWPFVIASTFGLAWSLLHKRSRSAGLMAAAVLIEATVLYWFAGRQHNAPYMGRKLFYLLLYVQAVGTALAGAMLVARLATTRVERHTRALGWAVVVAIAAVGWGSVAVTPRGLDIHIAPAVTHDLERAGEWTRANLPAHCIEYLVGDDEATYWLHLAVLGNPRMSERTGDPDTYELKMALVRWLTPGGLPYAIVDLPSVPAGVREELDVVQTFGTAAVARQRRPATCPAR